MKLIHHKTLNPKKWYFLSFFEQMANIGSEVERTIIWKNKNNKRYADLAFERALELIDLTVADVKNKDRLKEILRVREVLADWYYFENEYKSTAKSWQKYFFAFNYAVRVNQYEARNFSNKKSILEEISKIDLKSMSVKKMKDIFASRYNL